MLYKFAMNKFPEPNAPVKSTGQAKIPFLSVVAVGTVSVDSAVAEGTLLASE
jgi:hypothetical protein